MPASLIDQEDGVGTGRDRLGDLREMQVHRLGIAGRQDQGRALAILWADVLSQKIIDVLLVVSCAMAFRGPP